MRPPLAPMLGLIALAVAGPGSCYFTRFDNPARVVAVGWTITDELLMSDRWVSSASGAVQQDGVDPYRIDLEYDVHTVHLCHVHGSTFRGLVEVYNGAGDSVGWIPALSATDGQVIGTFMPIAAADYTFVVSEAGGLSTSPPDASKWYTFRVDAGDHTGEGCPRP